MIEVQSVTKTYGKKANLFTALDQVSFRVKEGTVVAIIGKSGSGKSTLMHVMSGLDSPTSGQVIFGDRNITVLKKRQMDAFRSREMSFIFQSFFVQGDENCYNNVSLPLEIAGVAITKRRAKIEKALASVQLLDKIKSRARDLSGGQKQRLAVARAIVNEPKILFADEPTGNLDSVTGAVVEELLFDYSRRQHATLVVVTHDSDLAAKCDMRVFLKDGQIDKIEGLTQDYSEANGKQPISAKGARL